MMWLLAGCDAPPERDASAENVVDWPDPITTLSETNVPGERLPVATERNPGLPEGLADAENIGLGTWTTGQGEAWSLRDDLAPGRRAGESSAGLLMFVHQSDAQIADCESPTRVVALDGVGATQAALRPQELYAIHALDAFSQRLNGINALVGLDFLVATGDNADSAQLNETEWFRDVLDGTNLRPDSGEFDSQRDDHDNDPIAEFTPFGLDFPWYAVAGNHDVLVQGNFEVGGYVSAALGTDASAGTRDLSIAGGPLAFSTVADPRRAVMERSDIAAVYLDTPSVPGPVGHGFSESDVADDSVNWTAAPVPGLRVIAVDANPNGPLDGQLSTNELEAFVVPALDAAQAAGELIVVTSHYALAELPMEKGGVLGDVLVQYPNVVLAVAGHWHTNRIVPVGEPGDASGFWEIQTASTNDWPVQVRLVELVDNGDGSLSIFTTMVDAPVPDGSLSARALSLAIIDWQSGWRQDSGTGTTLDRNTELVQIMPVDWQGTKGDVRSFALP